MSRAAPAIRPAGTPRLSLLTMYAPPPCGYARIVWRYELTTTAIRTAIAMLIGIE